MKCLQQYIRDYGTICIRKAQLLITVCFTAVLTHQFIQCIYSESMYENNFYQVATFIDKLRRATHSDKHRIEMSKT
jgi:hypothetical protein